MVAVAQAGDDRHAKKIGRLSDRRNESRRSRFAPCGNGLLHAPGGPGQSIDEEAVLTGRQTTVALTLCAACTALVVTGIATAVTGREWSREGEQFESAPAPSVSAVTFLRQVIVRLAANDYAGAWQSLDPRQQRLVHQDAYARCESLTPIPGRLDTVEALDAHAEQVVVPGSGGPATASTVVTFRLAFAPLPSQAPAVVRVRAHALRNDGRWSWMLPAKRLALHTSGRCGVSPARAGSAA
jgi:hypothetical protein